MGNNTYGTVETIFEYITSSLYNDAYLCNIISRRAEIKVIRNDYVILTSLYNNYYCFI